MAHLSQKPAAECFGEYACVCDPPRRMRPARTARAIPRVDPPETEPAPWASISRLKTTLPVRHLRPDDMPSACLRLRRTAADASRARVIEAVTHVDELGAALAALVASPPDLPTPADDPPQAIAACARAVETWCFEILMLIEQVAREGAPSREAWRGIVEYSWIYVLTFVQPSLAEVRAWSLFAANSPLARHLDCVERTIVLFNWSLDP